MGTIVASGRSGDVKNERIQVALNYMAVADAATVAVGMVYLPFTCTILRAGMVVNEDIAVQASGSVSKMTVAVMDRETDGAGTTNLGNVENTSAFNDDTYIAIISKPVVVRGGSVVGVEVTNVDFATSTPSDFMGGTLYLEVSILHGVGA